MEFIGHLRLKQSPVAAGGHLQSSSPSLSAFKLSYTHHDVHYQDEHEAWYLNCEVNISF